MIAFLTKGAADFSQTARFCKIEMDGRDQRAWGIIG